MRGSPASRPLHPASCSCGPRRSGPPVLVAGRGSPVRGSPLQAGSRRLVISPPAWTRSPSALPGRPWAPRCFGRTIAELPAIGRTAPVEGLVVLSPICVSAPMGRSRSVPAAGRSRRAVPWLPAKVLRALGLRSRRGGRAGAGPVPARAAGARRVVCQVTATRFTLCAMTHASTRAGSRPVRGVSVRCQDGIRCSSARHQRCGGCRSRLEVSY